MTIEIPGYKIIRTLGKGGMATVYLAEQGIFEREVALKVMSKALADDPSFGQRFFREARIVSRLMHPNIVTVHDVGEHEGYYYLAMEYIDGGDLKKNQKTFSVQRKIEAIKDIARALEYASQKGYVHRDIKPENIMFHTSDGRAVLTDFGIARAAETDASMTQTGTAIGTPHYMSPEQAKGQLVDHRSDIYSLGVVFYLLFSGRVPYDAESAVAIGIKHITEPVPLLPIGMNSLQPLVDKMMAKRPESRFQNPHEVISALEVVDIARLELENEAVQREINERQKTSDADSPTIVATVSAARVPTEINETTISNTTGDKIFVSSEPFTVTYELDDDTETKSTWLWVLGVLAVAVLAMGIYSFQFPEQARNQVDSITDWTSERMSRLTARFEQSPDDNGNTSTGTSTNAVPDTGNVATESPPANDSNPIPAGDATEELELSAVPQTGTGEENIPAGEEIDPANEAPVANTEDPAVTALRNRISSLELAYAKDSAFLPDLVAAHRELIAARPDDEAAGMALRALRESAIEKANNLALEGKVDLADRRLTQIKHLFPEMTPETFAQLKRDLAEQPRIGALLVDADKYLQSGAISEPAGGNALESYRQVLALDADNPAATEGLATVLDLMIETAGSSLASGEVRRANDLVTKVLEIDNTRQSAIELKGRIDSVLTDQTRLDELITQGTTQLENGNLFAPGNGSAYYYFTQVLTVDPQNAAARTGIDKTIDVLAERIAGFIAEERFDLAENELATPLKFLPQNSRLLSMQIAINEAIAEKIFARQPRVSQLLVKPTEFTEVEGVQSDVVSPGRSIFVGFRYENFNTERTVVEAVLSDATGSVRIAKVPVEVVGSAGRAYFRVDRPVLGFTPGLYNLVILHGESTLISSEFRVVE